MLTSGEDKKFHENKTECKAGNHTVGDHNARTQVFSADLSEDRKMCLAVLHHQYYFDTTSDIIAGDCL